MSELKLHAPSRGKLGIATPFVARGAAAKLATTSRPKHSVWDDPDTGPIAISGGMRATWARSYRNKLRVTDTIVVSIAVVLAYVYREYLDLGAAAHNESILWYLGLSGLILGCWLTVLGVYHTRDSSIFGQGAREYRRVLGSTVQMFGAFAIVMVVLRIDVVRGYFAVALPLGMLLLAGSRWMWRRWLCRQRLDGKCMSKVVVLGMPEDVDYVITQLGKNASVGYQVAGVALAAPDRTRSHEQSWSRLPVSSSLTDVTRLVLTTGADTVIVAGQVPGGNNYIKELGWRLEDTSTQLVLASSLTNVAGPRVHWRPVEGLPLMHVELPQYTGGKHVFKRAMDMVCAASALIILSPLFLALALIIRLDSPGPVIFKQERVGRNGTTFWMFKFRSMVVNAEAELEKLREMNQGAGVLFKMQNDPRVTRCGSWLRRFSLDELPQFWNVLMGDMSLVGPRPPLEDEVAGYEKPAHRRLLIKPGITGLWQISGRSDLSWDESIRLDLYYVENWSFTGDVMILWRTARAMYKHDGAY